MPKHSPLWNFAVRAISAALWLPGKGFQAAGIAFLQEVLARSGHRADQPPVARVETPRGQIDLVCMGALARWRAETFLTKEPETIAWIEAFQPGDVLWDIGANIGLYSLYAALRGAARVVACEPSAANYLVLNRNIEINGLDDRVTALCIALNDRTVVDELHMQDTDFASALSSFAEPIDCDGRRFNSVFRQGMVGFSIDDLIALCNPPFPNHIKIDVDGIEAKIIAGAHKTLLDPRLKSLSVELEEHRPDETNAVIAAIESAGFIHTGKHHAKMFDDGPYAGIYNYHFHRTPPEPPLMGATS